MKNNVKMRRLGDYIRQVDVRNRDLAVTNLKGLSIEKIFIESIANTIGTDLRGYKIVKPRQFAYAPVTSRNGEKITVALYDGKNNCIISQAYTAFEIIDETELLPEYLMQWFRRPEFDRYARFHSHGSARETFDWEEMCDVLLPVPLIEEQREIVARHKAIEHKIDVNRRLIAKLEETARIIYRHTFVENIDPENLGTLSDLVDIKYGKDHKSLMNGCIPILGSGGIMRYGDKSLYENESVLIPRKGSLNNIIYIDEPFWTVDTMFYTIPKINGIMKYIYMFLEKIDFLSLCTGSAVPSMTTDFLNSLEIRIPKADELIDFNNQVSPLFRMKLILEKDIKHLSAL